MSSGPQIVRPAPPPTGVAAIDQEHQRYLELLQAIEAAAAVGGADLLAAIDAFIAFLADHFRQEEELMMACSHADSLVAGHAEDHDRLSATLAKLRRPLVANPGQVPEFVRTLRAWLDAHVRAHDLALARAAIEAGLAG